MNYTIGGFPENDAWQWDGSSKQRLGHAIEALLSHDKEKHRRGYIDYYELRQRFMPSAWEAYIDALDRFRADRNAKTITAIVREIRDEIVDVKPKQQSQEVSMGLVKIVAGLKLTGEGLIELSEQLKGFQLPQTWTVSPENSAYQAAAVGPQTTETGIEKPTESATVAEENKKAAEPVEELPADLLAACKKIVVEVVRNNPACKSEMVELLKSFGATSVPTVPAERLPELYKALREKVEAVNV